MGGIRSLIFKGLRMSRETTLFEAAGPVEVSAEKAVAVFRCLAAVLLHQAVLFVLQLPMVV